MSKWPTQGLITGLELKAFASSFPEGVYEVLYVGFLPAWLLS